MQTKKPPSSDGEQSEVKRNALATVDKAKALTVTTQEQATGATEIVKEIKRRRGQWLELIDPVVKSNHEAWKRSVELRDSIAKPLDEAERFVKGKVGEFLAEQERQRREAEAAAQAEANRVAEQQRKAELAALKAAGDREAVKELKAAPIIAPVITLAKAERPQGTYTVETWQFQIVDAVLIPREYLTVDEAKIRKVVQALKSGAVIPGVKVYATTETRVRA